MRKMWMIATWVLLGLTLNSGRAEPTTQPAAGDAELTELVAAMTGSFSSEEQSKTDLQYFDIRLHMARIWAERTGEYWLYVEQARSDSLDQPYRQRIYHVHRRGDGKLESVVYTFVGDAIKYAGEWKKDKPLADLTPDKLELRKGCEIVLSKNEKGEFIGSTDGKGCGSVLQGASYATSEVTITADHLQSWDRGYGKDDKQVWGAKKGPYVFKKLKQ